MLTMVRFLVVLLTSFMMASAYASSCEKHRCMAVVDAGSTGSRLHIFSYDLNNKNQPIQIKEIWSKKIKPGLASINPTKESMSAYLSILLNDAPEHHLPLYFYATAGMRLVSKSQQRLVYDVIRQSIVDKSEWQLMDLKTITGREEGIFGWLAVNYQLGAFDNPKQPLVGVLDMGGASVQITFPVDQGDSIAEADRVKLQVGSRQLTLFVHSFLGLGQTVMAEQFLDVSSCFISGYILPDESVGAGDMTSCGQVIEKLINHVHDVNDMVKGAMSHRIISSWYTMGGSASLVNVPIFHFSNHRFTSQDLMEQADNQICHRQWDDLSNKYPTNEYLYGYCLYSAYYYALLVDGYGIAPQQPIQYFANSQDFDWSLGVLLQQYVLQSKNSF